MIRRVFVLTLLSVGVAQAHRNYTRPDLHVTCKIGNKALLCGISLPRRVLAQILSRPVAFSVAPTPEEQVALRDALAAVLQQHNPVRIDGVRVEPDVRSTTFLLDLPHESVGDQAVTAPGIKMHQSRFTVVRMVLGYPLGQTPQRIDLTWDLSAAYTDTSPDERPEARNPIIPVNLLHAGQWLAFELTPDEPQFTWHAPRAAVTPTPPPPAEPTPAVVSVPLVAAGAVGLGLALLLAWRDRRGLLAVVLAAGVAALTWPLAPIAVPMPWTVMQPPSDQDARRIFAELHGTVYRAFTLEGEDAIYDTLAQAVDGTLLDWLYGRIHQALIMKDQGGAVARVQGVDILGTRVEPGDGGAAFRVRAEWRVLGTVTHWGHSHQRANQYAATYTIDRRGAAWKIVAVVPEDQRRVDP